MPFGEMFTCPSPDSGAVPTKKTGWATNHARSRSSICSNTVAMPSGCHQGEDGGKGFDDLAVPFQVPSVYERLLLTRHGEVDGPQPHPPRAGEFVAAPIADVEPVGRFDAERGAAGQVVLRLGLAVTGGEGENRGIDVGCDRQGRGVSPQFGAAVTHHAGPPPLLVQASQPLDRAGAAAP